MTAPRAGRRGRVARLGRLVSGFAGRPIAVLGDFVVDRFVYGDIARISREAPVPILEHRRTVEVPGGAGNAAANLAALGARVLPIGVVGDDAAGRRIAESLAALGCPLTGLVELAGWATPSKSRIVAGGSHTRSQQIVRLDEGAGRGTHPPAVHAELRRRLAEALPHVRALLVSDYGYGAAEPSEVAPLLRLARRLRLPVTVDSRQRVLAFTGATACTPNQEELEAALGVRADEDDEVAAAARKLARRARVGLVLATRGARGMCLVQPRRSPLWLAAHGSGEVADLAGAGDTVIASFTLALAAGAAPSDAAFLANCAAGIVVTKAGTATVTPAELARAVAAELRR